MKTVYLHIGTHRTGSTSIQRFMANAEEALAEQGIIYPKTGRPDTDWTNQYGHHELARSMTRKRRIDNDQVWVDLREEIQNREGNRVVLSAEGFERVGEDEYRQIQRTIDHMNPYPIHVIVYLRPPLQFLKSVYNKRVEMGSWSGSLVDFVRDMALRRDYGNLVSRWEHHDRVRSVDIRLFEKARETPGLEADFADAIGASFRELETFVDVPVNASSSEELLQVARWINQVRDMGPENGKWQTLMHRARRNVLGRRWPGTWLTTALRPFMRDSFATKQAADLLREEIGDSHRRFLRSYIPPEDRKYLQLF